MGQQESQEKPKEPEEPRVDDAIGNLPWNAKKFYLDWTKNPLTENEEYYRKAKMVEDDRDFNHINEIHTKQTQDNQGVKDRWDLLQKQVKKENDITIKEKYDLIKKQIDSSSFKKDYIYTNTHRDEIDLYNYAVDYLNDQEKRIPDEILFTLSRSKKNADKYMLQVLNNIDNYHIKEYGKIQEQIQVGGKRNKSKKSKKSKKVKKNKSKHFK